MVIGVVGQANAPVNTNLAHGGFRFNGLVNFLRWPAVIFFFPATIEPKFNGGRIFIGNRKQFIQLIDDVFVVSLVEGSVLDVSILVSVPNG